MRHRLLWLLLVLLPVRLQAATYEIGPGKTYTTIGAAPWSSLVAGDTVNIYYATYHEGIKITTRGAPGNPIIIQGIPDGGGNLPVIDGTDATTGPNFATYRSWQYGPGIGLVYVGLKSDWGTTQEIPGYITIKNLRIQGAVPGKTWYDSGGTPHASDEFGVYLQTSEYVTLDGLEVIDNGNGIFGNSNWDSSPQSPPVVTRGLTVKNCKVWGNGSTTSYLVHNVYVESDGVVYESNYFGPLRFAALGANVKDRSSGFVFRYNYVHNGAHLLDLVQCQNGCHYIYNETTYRQVWVYGNIFRNSQVDEEGGSQGAGSLFHYGREWADDRNGTLYFYNNTVVYEWDQSNQYKMVLFELGADNPSDVKAEIHNNIFLVKNWANGPASAAYWKGDSPFSQNSYGDLTFGNNLVSAGFELASSEPEGGVTTGLANLIEITGNDPHFASLGGHDYHLALGSEAIGAASALPAIVASGNALGQDFTPVYEYVAVADSTARSTTDDLGGFEYAAGEADPPTIVTTTLADGVVGQSYSATVATTGGIVPCTWSIMAGSICGGLSLSNGSGCTGSITGTPDTAETCNFTVRVEDDNSDADAQALSIDIAASATFFMDVPQVQYGATDVLVRYGAPGLPYESNCTVTLYSAGGAELDTDVTTEGPARRNGTFAGLTLSTLYRLAFECENATPPEVELDTFTTLAAPSAGDRTVPISFGDSSLSAAARVTVEYDDNATLSSPATEQNTSCGFGCTVNLTIPAGLWYFRHKWQDGSDNVLATGSVQALLVE